MYARAAAPVYISTKVRRRCGTNGSARAMYKKEGGQGAESMRLIHAVVMVFLVTFTTMFLVVASLSMAHYMAYREFTVA